MLSINWSDVWKMVESIKVPLIVIGVALALAIIVSLAVFKMGKPARKLTRSTAWVAALIAVVVAVVSMMYGGFKTVLDLAAGTGVLTDASKAQVEDLGNDISDEGMVLLKNQGGALPLAKGSAINVWGWGSTNPIYGGTGSGSLSKDNPTTTLLDGLHNAGFTTNDELTNLYTAYRAERPEVGMFKADWSLPEPTQDKYSDDLLSNATAFGDTAVVTIARSGGEGFDTPTRAVTSSTSRRTRFWPARRLPRRSRAPRQRACTPSSSTSPSTTRRPTARTCWRPGRTSRQCAKFTCVPSRSASRTAARTRS